MFNIISGLRFKLFVIPSFSCSAVKIIEMDQSPCKKRWTLWTVWSTELGKMIDTPGVSLKYFTHELLNVVKEKDQTFSYDKKESLYVVSLTSYCT